MNGKGDERLIVTVTLSPALDKTVTLPMFQIGQVNRVEKMRLDPGGKGINVSKTIQALHGKSVAMGILGGSAGRYIKTCLNKAGIENDFVIVREPTRTNLKIIDPMLHTNTDINEPGLAVSSRAINRVFESLSVKVASGDTVVLAGKTPPGTDGCLYGEWTKRLLKRGVRVCLDADGPQLIYGVEAMPDIIKPNEEEFSRLVGRNLKSISEIAQAALDLNRRGIGQIMVSMGENGALFVRGGRVKLAHGIKVPVKSTVGAGDAAVAALALSFERGDDLPDTIRLAIAAGSAAVMCEGTETISPETVRELIPQVIVEDFIV
jgi:1-phosphofructokinase